MKAMRNVWIKTPVLWIVFLLGFSAAITKAESYRISELTWKNTEKGCHLYSALNEVGLPQYYFMDISDYPCDSKEVLPMELRIYWDIWGNFLKIGLKEGHQLPKLNNQLFNGRDYSRLHELLNNPKSEIQYYQLDDLNPKQAEIQYYSVDAISGATVQDVSYSSVAGAVKTCYSLWTMVYGGAVTAIRKNTLSIYAKNEMFAKAEFAQLNSLKEKVAHYQHVSVSFFDSFIQSSTHLSPEMIYCILELSRQSRLEDKHLFEWLATSFAEVKNKGLKIAIYNFLTINNFKTKEIRSYNPGIDYL